ncbi:hypothetical protein P7C70_g6691, partial [Phenoliferia sp. Uapishka_3]
MISRNFSLNSPVPSEPRLGDISILTGRTMDDIKAARGAELLVISDRREAQQEVSQWESWGGEASWNGDASEISDEDVQKLLVDEEAELVKSGVGGGGQGEWQEYDALAWWRANEP